jgi:hypothetical protein
MTVCGSVYACIVLGNACLRCVDLELRCERMCRER